MKTSTLKATVAVAALAAAIASFIWALEADGWWHWFAMGCAVGFWAASLRYAGHIGLVYRAWKARR